LEREDLVVATGEVGTELRLLEFPGWRESSVLRCFLERFLFPNMEVAVVLEFDSLDFDLVPVLDSSKPPPRTTSLPVP
jgi:hypothetical protein